MELKNLLSFDPKKCISGKVMRLNRITANVFRKYLKPFGVSNSQVTLLFILTKRDNLNQKQLSEIAVLEKSSLSRNLKRLIEQKLLSKDAFPIIKITDKGKALVNEIIPEWEKAMREIEIIMGADGKSALDLLMNKVTDKNYRK